MCIRDRAASILDMKFKDVLIACMGGVLLAGIIMGLASAGPVSYTHLDVYKRQLYQLS